MGEGLATPGGSPLQILLEQGGIAAYAILVAGFILIILGLERMITLYFRLSFDSRLALENIRGLVLQRKYTEALQVCNSQISAPDLSVIKAGLLAAENGREAMNSSVNNSVLNISLYCEKRLPFLALIANVGTLLGLFGTILGLIKTFQSIANADAAEKGKLLGLGISEAMYCTASGLLVGILAMVIHTLCVAKADQIVGAAQDAGLKLMTWIEQSERTPHGAPREI